MASADVFVFPSITGSQGNAVLEAQASGLPVVVSDAAGLHEIIADRVTGFVAKAGSAEAFGDHVARLLRNDDERRDMGRRAREHAMAHTWARTLAPLAQAWRTAADRRRITLGRRVQSSTIERIA
jgi:glycosyltransferase involved in cell wall biosynthesis